MQKKFDSQFFENILNGINSNICITDAETDEIVYMNDSCRDTFHLANPEGAVCWKVLQKGMTKRCDFCKIDRLKTMKEGQSYFWEKRNTVNGKIYLYQDTLKNVGDTLYHVQNSIDITDYVQICMEALTDELTGVLTRKEGKNKIEEILKCMKKDEQFTVALYDINGLKWVNDTYGHLEGDRLLSYVAQTIEQELEAPDFVFRLSGDEFIIIFMNKSTDEANRWMHSILDVLKKGRKEVGIDYDVTFSYGLATIQGREKLNVSDVLSIVDTQMYIQKRDYYMAKEQKKQSKELVRPKSKFSFQYNKENLFDVLDNSIDDYIFASNLKTGKFMYSYKMMLDFGLPSQVLENAVDFWEKRIHPEDGDMFRKSNLEIAEGKAERHTIVYRAKNAKGEWVHLMCRGQMVRDKDGNPDLFGGIIRNLDKKESDINEELRIISESSSEGIFKVARADGYPVLYANDGYYELHGYTKKQMAEELGNHASNFIYQEDQKKVEEMVAEGAAAQNRHMILEYRICKRDGSIAWVHVNAGIIPDANGTDIIIGMIMDITERRELEEKLMRTEQLFQTASKNTRFNMWEYDIEQKRILQTEESREIHGEEMIVENVPERLIETGYVHPDYADMMRKFYQEVEAGNPVTSVTLRVRLNQKSEQYWWEKTTYTIVRWNDGKPVWAVGMSEDVTAQKEAEIRVFEEARMRELLSEDIFCSFQINLSKNSLEKLWNYVEGKEEINISGKGYEEIYRRIFESIANEDDKKKFQQQYDMEQIFKIASEDGKISDFEFRQKQKNGVILWVILNMRIIVSPETREMFLFGYLKNIDSIKRRELSLKQKAEIDEVSGFYNFSTAQLLIEEIIETAEKNSCALALLDVDNFKEINETGGFLSGDILLREISSAIAESISFPCVKARVNGDVFLLFCYNLSGQNGIRESMEKIRKYVSKTYNIEGEKFEVTVSAGMAMSFSAGMTYEQIYQCAGHALNIAKREGKNRLLMYRDVEKMEDGMNIEIVVDPENCEIIDMNTTGQIAFGVPGVINSGIKCHELLYNDIMPCSFCHKKMAVDEKQSWKCFVTRLNKVMYVKVQCKMKEGKMVKCISLQEKHVQDQNVESMTVLNMLKECWKRIERGESTFTVLATFINYIADIFQAGSIALYEKEENSGQLYLEQIWNMEQAAARSDFNQEFHYLEEALEIAFPQNNIVIEGPESVGYAKLEAFYGEGKVPLPVILTGSYEEKKLVSLLVLEHAKEKAEAFQTLDTIAEFMHQIIQICNLHQQYENAIQYDQKTGILNYQSYMCSLEQLNEEKYSTFGIFGIHIADLKTYNKIYGTKEGDMLLKATADILVNVFGEENVFRMSGARFFALSPNITYENFQHRCDKGRRKLMKLQPEMFADATAWGEEVLSIKSLQEQVEEKLQIALTKMRMLNSEGERHSMGDMLSGIREAIENGEFCTYLQPKANVQTGEICGAEALIRYCDKQKGIIAPGRFLPQIESSGFIRVIDLFVLKDVCRIMKKWLALGWKPFPISLNFSRATILEPGILEETDKIVEEIGVPKELLQIEVTETIGSIDNNSLKGIVERFKEAGYKFALDDFGAEYSNIYVLYSLHLDALKLDRRIISDIYHDARAGVVVENVIDICKKLNIECVAEGVETEEHLGVLKKMSCDVIQGYLLNKPLPEDEFERQYIRKGSSK